MINSIRDLENFIDTNATELYNNRPKFTIQFGCPVDGKATVHINKDGVDFVALNCFTWNQTLGMRRVFSYGDNHRSRNLTWLNTVRVLHETINLIEREVEIA